MYGLSYDMSKFCNVISLLACVKEQTHEIRVHTNPPGGGGGGHS